MAVRRAPCAVRRAREFAKRGDNRTTAAESEYELARKRRFETTVLERITA